MKVNTKLFYYKASILMLAILMLVSCRKSLESPTWESTILFPVLKSELKISQLVSSKYLNENNSNEFIFNYKNAGFSFNLNDQFIVPDTLISRTFNIPTGPLTLVPGQIITSDQINKELDLDGIFIKEMELFKGTLELTITSSINDLTEFEYSLPLFTKNGNPLVIQRTLPAGTVSSPSVISQQVDLSGYLADLTGRFSNGYNALYYTSQFKISDFANNVVVNADDYVSVEFSFKETTPYFFKGKIESQEINLETEKISIDAFSALEYGNINLTEAKVELTITNEMGMDLKSENIKMVSHNSLNNKSVELNSPLSSSSINITRAILKGKSVSDILPSTTVESIDQENSNIEEFVSILPDEIYFDLGFQLNPLGNISNSSDFIFRNTGIRMEMEMEVPVKFSTANLSLLDTTSYQMFHENIYDDVKTGYINLIVKNSYPLKVSPQFYLLNEDLQLVDSIFQKREFIKEAVYEDGILQEKTETILQIPIDNDLLKDMYQNKLMVIKTKLLTNDEVVKTLTNQQSVDMTLSVEFTLENTLND